MERQRDRGDMMEERRRDEGEMMERQEDIEEDEGEFDER